MDVHSLERLLAIIGGVSLVVGPFAGAWLTIRAQKAVATAPSFKDLEARVKATERWQEDHADDVKLVPKLAAILDRVEQTLDRLVTRLDA